jgi:hypothetical protein
MGEEDDLFNGPTPDGKGLAGKKRKDGGGKGVCDVASVCGCAHGTCCGCGWWRCCVQCRQLQH